MKLVVFGATGGIGGHLVQQALAQGHQVTAIVRTPAKMGTEHPQLRVVQGDVTLASTLAGALAGHDAVLLVLGVVDRRAPTRSFRRGPAMSWRP